jgi:murein hydrolase activator
MAFIQKIILCSILCCAMLVPNINAQKKKSKNIKTSTATAGKDDNANNIDRNELESQRQNILNEIKQTQMQLQSLQKDKNATYAQLQALQNKLNARQALINNINKEINLIERTITNANDDVKSLTLNLAELRKHYSELMRYSYKQRTSQDLVMFIFSSNGFYDAVRRYNYIKQYREYRKEQAKKIIETSTDLKGKILTLKEQKEQKDLRLKEQEEQKQVISVETSQKNLVMKDLKGKEKDLNVKVAEQKKVADDLNKAIAAAIRREIEIARRKADEERKRIAREKAETQRKEKEAYAAKLKAADDERRRLKEEEERKKSLAKVNKINGASAKTIKTTEPARAPDVAKVTSNKTTTNPRFLGEMEPSKPAPVAASSNSYNDDLSEENRTLSNNFELNKGNLNSPVTGGYVCEHFGKNKHPLYNVVTENYGVDIRTSKGAQVKSVYGGEVSSVFYIAGAGNNILINHGSYFTLYSKIDKASVTKGMKVSARQVLGTVMTDGDGNSQVHFEIWKVGANGALQKVNPEQWIR